MNNILIFGAGSSGVGAAYLAKKFGADVTIFDNAPVQSKFTGDVERLGIKVVVGDAENILDKKSLIIKSPGVSSNNPLLLEARQRGLPIIGEIEFASRFTKAKLIGITGTNGKTTTTSLTYHLLKSTQVSVQMAGNIGESFAKMVAEVDQDPEYYVLELSSFQLEDMHEAKMHIACMLNITPDHLDRHVTMDSYVEAKFRILQNMTRDDHFVYNATDENVKFYLGQHKIAPRLHAVRDLKNFSLPNSLRGPHNSQNTAAAVEVAKILNLKDDTVQAALNTFAGVPHRIQYVADIGGVVFYNDSKATNVDSARVALESFSEPIVWIAGGKDKGNVYEEIFDLVGEKVKAIVCLTTYPGKIVEAFSKLCPIYVTQSMVEAVDKAYECAVSGDVVLLSPACASFDLFENYEHRGEEYMRMVLRKSRSRQHHNR